MNGAGLVGRLVAHHEVITLPLWRGHNLKEMVGRAPPDRPLLVVGVDVVHRARRPGEDVSWALVTDGACTGWLPTPLGRLTLLDEEATP